VKNGEGVIVVVGALDNARLYITKGFEKKKEGHLIPHKGREYHNQPTVLEDLEKDGA